MVSEQTPLIDLGKHEASRAGVDIDNFKSVLKDAVFNLEKYLGVHITEPIVGKIVVRNLTLRERLSPKNLFSTRNLGEVINNNVIRLYVDTIFRHEYKANGIIGPPSKEKDKLVLAMVLEYLDYAITHELGHLAYNNIVGIGKYKIKGEVHEPEVEYTLETVSTPGESHTDWESGAEWLQVVMEKRGDLQEVNLHLGNSFAKQWDQEQFTALYSSSVVDEYPKEVQKLYYAAILHALFQNHGLLFIRNVALIAAEELTLPQLSMYKKLKNAFTKGVHSERMMQAEENYKRFSTRLKDELGISPEEMAQEAFEFYKAVYLKLRSNHEEYVESQLSTFPHWSVYYDSPTIQNS